MTVIATLLLLSACASRLTVKCGEQFDADSPAIRERVLAAHAGVRPLNVLKCIAVPTQSGFSTDPDQEACLVQIEPGSVPRAADPSGRLHDTPQAVLKLAPDLPERTYAAVIYEGGAAVYRTFNLDQVVLYAPNGRCFVLEEIT